MKISNNNVMIDLETLGIRPGCVILSIGAVRFNTKRGIFGPSFYRVVNRQTCLEAGLVSDPDTQAWWENQSPEAQLVLREADNPSRSSSLGEILLDLKTFLETISLNDDTIDGGRYSLGSAEVWSNGADFDLPILSYAYKVCGLGRSPWRPYSGRCYRTLKNLFPGLMAVKEGIKHNALDDAAAQARHATKLLSHLEGICKSTK